MAKYSFEEKLKVVNKYLQGEGSYTKLASEYSIKSRTLVVNWVNAYREFGEVGLMRKRKKKSYSVQTKLNAIELYLTTEMSIREVANAFGINAPSIISAWLRKYREDDVDGLFGKRGHPPMKEEPKATNKNENKSLANAPENTNRIKELERQILFYYIMHEGLDEEILKPLDKYDGDEDLRSLILEEVHNIGEDYFKLGYLLGKQ